MTLLLQTVKEWLAQPCRVLSKGKEMSAAKLVDVGVQVGNATEAQEEDIDQESEPEERESPVWTESNDDERL